MFYDALDITIESRNDTIWLSLSGPFYNEQIPNIREKFHSLLEDGNRYFIVNLENVTSVGDGIVTMFLNLLNLVRGKQGELLFVFKNESVSRAFASYHNLFTIYPDASLIDTGTFFHTLRRQGRMLTRKTGVRISRPVALFLLFILCGWFLSLFFIIHLQNQRLQEQQFELQELTEWKQRTLLEIRHLQERIRPLEQLGIIEDSTEVE